MKFHYEFAIKKLLTPITHHHSTMMMGSCFTENIGELLKSAKFNILENPNGILFNPISVAEAINLYINNKPIDDAHLFCLNESWHSWCHHSRYSGVTKAESVQKINESTTHAYSFLKHADYLFITLGSAWVYELSEIAPGFMPGKVAANNHKAPSSWFNKKLLTANATVHVLHKMLEQLKQFNPHLKVIFTISPVRHLREGVIENNRSKAVLIQAVHDLVNQSENLYYFPAYELVIDDLRDYRFYAEDLVHPNYHATQYVWEKFKEAAMAVETQEHLKVIKEIMLAYQHKPFNALTNQHADFLKKYLIIAKQLMETHPEIKLSTELDYFRTGLK